MKEKKNYFGNPYTQGVKERPREVESDRLRLCIIKSIISVTICVKGFLGLSHFLHDLAMMVAVLRKATLWRNDEQHL